LLSCFDSDTGDVSLTSSTNANCSPRWIVYPQTYYNAGWRYWEARTLRECLDYCANNNTCATVQWLKKDTHSCWPYSSTAEQIGDRDYITLYEIVRQCDSTSGE